MPNLPKVYLKNLHLCDPEEFYPIAVDPEVVEFFAQFKEKSKEDVLQTMKSINEQLEFRQYWGIFNENEKLVGFIALRKSHFVHKELSLWRIKQPDYELKMEDLLLSPLEEKKAEARDKANSPYTVDFALLTAYRGKGYARAAFQLVYEHAREADIKELYFEVRTDNSKSLKLLDSAGCQLLIASALPGFPNIYQLIVNPPLPMTKLETQERLSLLRGTSQLIGFNIWRQIIAILPELIPHQRLLVDLFTAISESKTRVELDNLRDDCHFESDGFEKILTIGTGKRSTPLSIIWSIAHEFGHALQAPATKAEKVLYSLDKYKREVDAWNKAEAWLQDTTYFRYNWASFFQFREERLKSYLP